jgi:hypothetical protein
VEENRNEPSYQPFIESPLNVQKRKGRSMSPKNASVAGRMFLEPRGFSLNSFNSFDVKFYTRVIVY